LEFAHQKKIFHRDIKPSNIMLDANGKVKIIDFGIAKGESDPNLTIAGSSTGTPAYMAPEQFNPTATINYALADIYAVGTTLFYMLTGDLPFKGDNPFALRDAKLFIDPVKPRDLNPDVPKNLEQIILKSIDKDPEARYASVGEMRSALLGEYKADVTQPVISKHGTKKARQTETPGKKSGKAVPILSVLALFVIAAAVYFFFFRGPKETHIAAPELKTPISGIALSLPRPEFEWSSSAPAGGTYSLEIAQDQSFTNPRRFSDLAATQFKTQDSLPDGNWYWRVQALDNKGKSGPYSATGAFIIATPLQTLAATGTLTIIIQPDGDLYIDDKLQGRNQSSATATLDTGRHVIRVENRDSRQKQIIDTVLITSGARESRTVAFQMPSPAKTAAQPQVQQAAYGEARVTSKPTIGAAIYIDGKLQDTATPFTFRLPVGDHELRAVMSVDGVDKTQTQTVHITPGGVEKVIFDFEK
jgi:hypothetical protein